MTKAEKEYQEKAALGAKYGPNVFCSNRGIAPVVTDSADNERAEARIKALADKRAEEKRKAAMDTLIEDDRRLERLLAMTPAKRATAFERESKGHPMGVNPEVIAMHERLDIPEKCAPEDEAHLDPTYQTRKYFQPMHDARVLNSDLKL